LHPHKRPKDPEYWEKRYGDAAERHRNLYHELELWWDPSFLEWKGDTWTQEVVLAHELMHTFHYVRGFWYLEALDINDMGPRYGNVSFRDWTENWSIYAENQVRAALGLDLRDYGEGGKIPP
jgi:hypothetical protein